MNKHFWPWPWVSFILLFSYLFLFVLFPYFALDQLQFWDVPGHYFAAWFLKNFGTDWNPFFYAGYPQDTFYAPLYHYLIVFTSYPFGLTLAFKLVNAASLLLLPGGIYYLARKFVFSPAEASLITLLAFIPIAGLALACGGTLYSLFIIGLGANSLGLVLYLFYFGSLKALCQGDYSAGRFFSLTILAAAIILCHFVVAFAAAITAFTLVLNNLSRRLLNIIIKHALIALAISAYFWLPLAAYSKNAGQPETILSMGFFLTIPILLLIIFGGGIARLTSDQRFNQTYFTLLTIFAITIFLDFGQVGLPMHAYRFIIYFAILAMMLPVKLIFNRLPQRSWQIAGVVVFFCLVGWQAYLIAVNNPRWQINNNRLFNFYDYLQAYQPYSVNPGLPKLDGRIIVLGPTNPLAPRALEHILALRSGNYFIKGLFGETPNSLPLNQLEAKLAQLLSQGDKAPPALLNNVRKLLWLYNINFLLSSSPIKQLPIITTVAVQPQQPKYSLYKLGSGQLVEPLTHQPLYLIKDWQATVNQWVNAPDARVLVKASSLPSSIATSVDQITSIETTLSPPNLRFIIKAKQPIPVLIKMGYFPRWRATANGRPITIYEAAPSLMLVYGLGEVVLTYQATSIDLAGRVISIIGLVMLFVIAKRLDFKNEKSRI
ncbi:hypothetical protein A2311_05965 [candidate division WOR-1 bacterium RIFOXYB2_FULL_48_7]|uniref:Membrane protein 6-pyruvoyl-tetrahydropterin synthase-related domain-containing protein n=1 Tax=candidate division WOR-1 bacterium RIFOXYB2_FULL_48_7 TaxID=1802583 RepID=A0A1F4TJP6_UNCSA|nr:MAG: hypothetical protein A2311_05965 [candidate division WOR-1 bacterium RIFOXYB2_FULL_48_7]